MKNDNTTFSNNKKKKEAIVASLAEKVEKAQGMIFTNYQGLTHQQIEGLKKNLKAADAEFVNTKNTLLLRALGDKIDTKSETDGAPLAEKFTQPTATLFIYSDIVAPLKELAKSIKSFKLPAIKFGIIEGKVLTDTEVVKVSNLPPLPALRAQLLGQMQAPISGLHRALHWNLQQLVSTLDAISQKKS